MGIKYTSTPYSKANFTAILTIPRSELPDPASNLYPLLTATDTGIIYKFDSDSTTIGTLPTGASGAGRWIPIGREVLQANRTYFVRTDGNDANNGFANTVGGSFLTIQKAINVLKTLDLNGFNVTITAIGNFTSQGTVDVFLPIGAGDITLQGDTGAIIATKIKKIQFASQKSICNFIIDAFEFVNPDLDSSCLQIINSNVLHGRISYNVVGFPINVSGGGFLGTSNGSASISIAKNGANNLQVLGICQNQSQIVFTPIAITYVGSPSFSLGVWYAEGNALITLANSTISGAKTGTDYVTPAGSNSTIRRPDFSYQSST